MAWYRKKLNLTQQKHAFIINQKKYTTTQNIHKKLQSGLVDIRPGNRTGLFSKEKITKGGDQEEKSEEKRITGVAYNINKPKIYIAPKIESRAHYVPKTAQGSDTSQVRLNSLYLMP